MAASVVIGQPDFTTITPGSGNSTIGDYSEGIAIDSAGNLLVTDEQNNRVLMFSNTRTVFDGPSCVAIGGTQNFPNSCDVSSLTINPGDTLIANVTLTNTGILTNNGHLIINSGSNNFGTINNTGGGGPDGTITINSGGNFNTGTINNNGTIIINSPLGTLTNSPGGTINNLGIITNMGQLDNACGATYSGIPASPIPVNDITCVGNTPTFSIPFPLNPGDAVCTPLVMNTDVASTESWYVKSAGGILKIKVIAHAVNGIDGETVTATAFDTSNTPVGTTTVSYPPGTPNTSEFSSSIVIPVTIPGGIYRVDITTPTTPPTQPHYRLDFFGATEAGISGPTFASLEEIPTKWILNVNPAENLDIDFFTAGTPTPATTVTYTLTSPTNATTTGTVPIIPGNEISIVGAQVGTWVLEVQSTNGHYRLDKSGVDKGIYVSGMSTPECNLPDLKVTKIGPASFTAGDIIHYDIHIENIGSGNAQNVGLIDTIPTEILGLTLVSTSPVCDQFISGGQITCGGISDIPVDSFFDVFVDLAIPSGASGTIINNAFANSINSDPNQSNNISQVSTSVISGGSGGLFCGKTINQFTSVINGTESNNVVVGTAGDDLINGLGGDDRIFGREGDDCIFGGIGNDYLVGGAGNDEIDGEDGNDKIWGQSGMDILYGSFGSDRIAGGADNDSIFGEDDNDFLWGQIGDDTLDGGNQIDMCSGGIGANTFTMCE
jgi:uncharacterized repeat protein (TIGR01451 family)